MLKHFIAVIALSVAMPAFAQSDIISVADDDPVMNAAIEKARGSLPQFWDSFAAPDTNEVDFALKLGIVDGADTEHFWCNEIEGDASAATCVIANEPAFVTNVAYGERVDVDPAIISDWMYYRDDKIVGGETIRALLPQLDKKEAARLGAQFAED